MAPKEEAVPKTFRLEPKLWERLDEYRHKQKFSTTTGALRFLLEYALKSKPARLDKTNG